MPVPVDPFSFTAGQIADADQVNARFAPLYNAATLDRIVRGVVNQNGTVANGQGFTVALNANVQYVVTFASAFVSVPAVAVTKFYEANKAVTAIVSLAAGSFVVEFEIVAGVVGCMFTFIAIGT